MGTPTGSLENVKIHTLAVHHAASQFRLGAQRHNVPNLSINSLDITGLRLGNSCYSNSYYRDTNQLTNYTTEE